MAKGVKINWKTVGQEIRVAITHIFPVVRRQRVCLFASCICPPELYVYWRPERGHGCASKSCQLAMHQSKTQWRYAASEIGMDNKS